jgi:hypothetical protein
MRKLLSSMFYGLVVVSMIAGLTQLIERRASAEAGVCCSASSDCPGQQLCYGYSYPLMACCDDRAVQCAGPNYCEDKRPD